MPNIVRNDLTIEGENLMQVLEAIGFQSTIYPHNISVLIDFERIMPKPSACPPEGWNLWITENWGTVPYGGALDGDILEFSETRIKFKFYTCWTSAYPVVKTLAEQNSGLKISYWSWDLTNDWTGEAAWENGKQTLFRPMTPSDATQALADQNMEHS